MLLFSTYNCLNFFESSIASDFPEKVVRIASVGVPPAFTFTFVSPESMKSMSVFLKLSFMLFTISSCVVFWPFVLYSETFIFAMNFLFFMLFLKATTTLIGLPARSFVPSKISQSLGTVILKFEAL